jgi:hypothetical protein
MKLFKFGLRAWITITSVIAFLVSWIIFGQTSNQVDTNSASATQTYSVPTLQPLSPIDTGQPSGFQLSTQNNQQQQPPRPAFVTGGS